MIKKSIILSFFIFLSINSYAFSIKVGLFQDYSVQTLVLTIVHGEYDFIMDSTYLHELKEGDIFYLTLVDKYINVSDKNEILGGCRYINLIAEDTANYFSIRPLVPAFQTHTYDDNCYFSVDINRIKIINEIELEKYLSGVVQAEGGYKAHIEYYKTQAILCRTYALKNLYKYSFEGFNLCDGVSCQSYKGRCDNKLIHEAVRLTQGLVLVDNDTNLISAAYHSNSGGQTQNSEDVWLEELPYLRSVNDPYSVNQRNYTWQKTIPIKDWRTYLAGHGLENADHLDAGSFAFYQSNRKKYYTIGDFSVELKQIRNDWDLKSTFFSILPSKDMVLFKGRGYGHGVGLSQEGAMRMAKQGCSYKKIIAFYFKDVFVIAYKNLSGQIITNK